MWNLFKYPPKYCDGCCVSTKPRNSIGLTAIAPEGVNNMNLPITHGPINNPKSISDNEKALIRDNSPNSSCMSRQRAYISRLYSEA
jgi:hypothetical protein